MRPKNHKHLCCIPKVCEFTPYQAKGSDKIVLLAEEVEALDLKDNQRLDQNEAAVRMQTSQSTFQRILLSARGKVSDALINGKSIEIETEQKNCC